jgi:hypothetical protein
LCVEGEHNQTLYRLLCQLGFWGGVPCPLCVTYEWHESVYDHELRRCKLREESASAQKMLRFLCTVQQPARGRDSECASCGYSRRPYVPIRPRRSPCRNPPQPAPLSPLNLISYVTSTCAIDNQRQHNNCAAWGAPLSQCRQSRSPPRALRRHKPPRRLKVQYPGTSPSQQRFLATVALSYPTESTGSRGMAE